MSLIPMKSSSKSTYRSNRPDCIQTERTDNYSSNVMSSASNIQNKSFSSYNVLS